MNFQEFLSGFLGSSAIEIIASVSGILCIYLLIKRNIWCWFFGLIQVTLFVYVFFEVKLYSDMALHVVYIFFQIYGWWNWQGNTSQDDELIIVNSDAVFFLQWSVLACLCAGLIGYLMQRYTDASFPYLDAFTTCASLVAQFLLTKRYWINWIFWIVVDIVGVYVYLSKGLYPTALLYSILLIMCIFGLISWLRQLQLQVVTQNESEH